MHLYVCVTTQPVKSGILWKTRPKNSRTILFYRVYATTTSSNTKNIYFFSNLFSLFFHFFFSMVSFLFRLKWTNLFVSIHSLFCLLVSSSPYYMRFSIHPTIEWTNTHKNCTATFVHKHTTECTKKRERRRKHNS